MSITACALLQSNAEEDAEYSHVVTPKLSISVIKHKEALELIRF